MMMSAVNGFGGVLGPQTLGEALRLLRHRAKVGRDHLARLVDISAGAISNYENDVSMPAASTLRRLVVALAGLLGCSPSELWDQMGQILDATLADSSLPAAAAGP